jgi:hypothetical protein
LPRAHRFNALNGAPANTAALVAATLNLDNATIAAMRKDKPLILPGQPR